MSRGLANIPAKILSRITKVFISNLPEKCSGNDLSGFIRSYGVIYDLYIARKRDKAGNRFGFVSFLDVKDSNELVRLICKTRIGDCWLRANIARFTLEEGEIRADQHLSSRQNDNINKNQKNGGRPPVWNPTSFYNGSKSFTDTLTGKSSSVGNQKSLVVKNEVEAFRDLHGRAVVARMIDLDALKSIHVIMNDLCPGMYKIQYLGGLSTLISFEDEQKAHSVLAAAREVIGRFASLDVWMGQSFSFERLAWLKLTGIPLQLISNEVIDVIGGSFGKIVHRTSRSDFDDDLSYDYVGVLVVRRRGLVNRFRWSGGIKSSLFGLKKMPGCGCLNFTKSRLNRIRIQCMRIWTSRRIVMTKRSFIRWSRMPEILFR
ncbi:putative RNA recognition motif domain, nucleotide-binding alpha-beta plait domain superfamily [Helianthus annuus]|uniref:RNA recognition motif domain, nucleotide-binding alpha-beta plait domain superfamily n=1 Tax=Helianthus annuus TaxID=4232 RepID=A0A9K3GSP1_HELAN|nr:putative RNA recognition motif domain, nucleotide-binding alpha-beta plait domain superfamily [Helianthus annuus]KAJ0427978.1 putative RNA recognition motif domain, nucleotide-binding alpha-beta plait domain superfamily [Helianthus annuus]KAJ0431957.1 putative RNA recognition motif domain, nucleotide-binding alpha-beta plait domain superfamily [Helianthus annuus]KAJ0635121.1 putative RNA recognition motif domain, nucleotide-binding alpha-beta plait domain superfamily [Helianthus annuus]